MGADEFRDHIPGFIFYKYLSERMHLFADEILKNDGLAFDAIRKFKGQTINRIPLAKIALPPGNLRKI